MDFVKALAAEYAREAAGTVKMLEAIPEDADLNYAPHVKSATLGRLADHLSDATGDWALSILTKDKLEVPADFKWPHAEIVSKAALIEKFKKGIPAVAAAIVALPESKWAEHWQFSWGGKTLIDGERWQIFRGAVISHMIHHRAQLGVTLRLMGSPIPGMYGPSADDQAKEK